MGIDRAAAAFGAQVISRADQLVTGDALIADGAHVRLFEKWTDHTRIRYLAYDFGSTPVKHREYVWGTSGDHRYTPARFTGSH